MALVVVKKQLLSSSLKSSRSSNIQYSKHCSLPPAAVTRFAWKDYSSDIFRKIQELGNVSAEDYLLTVARHEILVDLAIRAGCGNPVFLPRNSRFIIKTVRRSEAKLLMAILPSYYDHIKKHENCLLTKYYGLHATRPAGRAKVYFVVMENMLQTDLHMYKKYDLKGSPQGRSPGRSINPKRVKLKDLDFNLCFLLHQSTRNQLLEQLRLDCEFLQKHGIMGYSLLLGVHIEALPEDQFSTATNVTADKKASKESENGDIVKRPGLDDSKQTECREIHHYRDPTLAHFLSPDNRPGTRLGAKLPARAVTTPHHRDILRSDSSSKNEGIPEGVSVHLSLGIIDFLKDYNVMRRIGHIYKSLQYNAQDIPSVKPELYATRFQDFLRQVFLAEDLAPDFEISFHLNPAFALQLAIHSGS